MSTRLTLQEIENVFSEAEAAAVGLDEAANACGPTQESLAARLRIYATIMRSLVSLGRTSTFVASLNQQTILESRR